ncbi:uncharacterized protein LOC116254777 isoform X1 [Nymphaea colorata]|nr:uncharacterized protein LOC116254777 isoform X1 [Nymphaea colorata]XP_049933864.1 uncharacterized protein LOC116254777 isoform X1 [Nymphaea colorata]
MQWIEAAPRPANQAICPFHRQTNRSFRCSPAAPRLPLLLSLAGTTALCSSDSSDSCPAFLKSISGEGLSFIHLLALQLSKVQKKLEGRKSTSCQCKSKLWWSFLSKSCMFTCFSGSCCLPDGYCHREYIVNDFCYKACQGYKLPKNGYVVCTMYKNVRGKAAYKIKAVHPN